MVSNDNRDSENAKKDVDQISGVETTGHVWDGIKELNNPAPRWWLNVFIVTIIFAIGYWVVYPAWPTLSGNTHGRLAWTEYKQLKASQAEIHALRDQFENKIAAADLAQIKNDPELYEYARAAGAVAFKNNCAACHGTGAQGSKGYPNLNDDDWLWGGRLEQIYTTILYGVRSGHEQAHTGQMPAWGGKDGPLSAEQIRQVAEFVQKLHLANKAEKTDSYLKGKEIFAANCAACHGENGEGNQELGAPRLSDDIWLYGGDLDTIIETITNGRAGVMPSWEARLGDTVVKELAIYVHSLGGGQ